MDTVTTPHLQIQIIKNAKPVECLAVTERNWTKALLSHSFSLGSPFPCRCPACTGCKPTFDLSLSSGAPDRRCSYGFAFCAWPLSDRLSGSAERKDLRSVPTRRPLCTEICLCLKRDEKSCNTLCTVLQCPDFAEPWTISIREREKIIGRQRKKESFAFSCSKLSVRGHLKST